LGISILKYMGKALETKRKILGLLRQKDMTITGLSETLGLSTATISQHMEELSRSGSVERVENEHFRKLKYYRIKSPERKVASNYNYVTYLVAAVLMSAAVLAFYLHGAVPVEAGPIVVSNPAPVQGNSTVPVVPGNYGVAINETPAAILPHNITKEINASAAYGFNFSPEMFLSNSSSGCVRVRTSYCDNNSPGEFACLNSSYYSDYLSQRQGAFAGQGRVCPEYLLAGRVYCVSVGGYCEVAFNRTT
jgi:DNA-binding transcriptional ArsR family regulator